MKIKTKHITYEQAMALPSWEHKKPKKPSALLAGVARLLLNGELTHLQFPWPLRATMRSPLRSPA